MQKYDPYIPKILRFLILPQKNTFLGVCLEFNIIEEHKNPEELSRILKEMASSHIKAVVNNNLDKSLLNRKAAKKYYDIWDQLVNQSPSIRRSAVSSTTVYRNPVSRDMVFYSGTPTQHILSVDYSTTHGLKELVTK